MDHHINFENVEPVNPSQTVAFVNSFVVSITTFLNHFSFVCETKLCDMSENIQRVEIQLAILEAKLNSIPELDHIKGDVPAASTAAAAPAAATVTATAAPAAAPAAAAPPAAAPTASDSADAEPAGDDGGGSGGLTVKDHPKYKNFFALIGRGIPAGAVKQQMQIQGLNPALLDTPDAPYPDEGGGGGGVEADGEDPVDVFSDASIDSDSEFSDS